MANPNTWKDPGMTEQLQQLCLDGLSAREIGKIMGFTRNSVIGKVHRMKFKFARSTPEGRVGKMSEFSHGKKKPSVPLPPAKPVPATPFRIDGELTTEENITRNMCRYPYGDPAKRDFHYCGNAVKEKSKYCPGHHVMCFQPMVNKNGSRRG